MRRLLIGLSVRLYRLLLHIYPPDHRSRFAHEMVCDFRELCCDRIAGFGSASRVWLNEYPSLLFRGTRERLGNDDSPGTGGRREAPGMRSPEGGWLDPMRQDIAHALRMLRRRPTFTLVIVATLTLGIGLNVAIFSVLYGVVLQPLPFDDPEELVRIGRASPNGDWLNPVSAAEFADLEGRPELLAELAGAVPSGGILTDLDEPAFVGGAIVTVGLFDMLGIEPARGRFFRPDDSDPTGERVIVLSDSFWRTRLGADPDVIGSTVELSGTAYVVVGIAPPGLSFRPATPGLSGAELWLPQRWTDNALQYRHSHSMMLYGRLRPGSTLAAASEEIDAIWRQVIADSPGNHLDETYELGLRAVPLRQYTVQSSRQPLVFLSGAVVFVLLIACVNVASLLLANAESRGHELAIRSALGASRYRLIGQFMTESLLVVGAGGVLGVLTAVFAVQGILGAFPGAIPRAGEIGLDLPVLGFAAGISLLTATLLGLAPARRARSGAEALKEAGRGSSARLSPLRKGMIIVEVALALILVIGAGLMVKSFWQIQASEMGFEPEPILVANLTLPRGEYSDQAAAQQLYESLMQRLEAHPGVTAAGMINLAPVRSFGRNISGLTVVGRPEARATNYVETRSASSTYFDALGVPVIRGRGFEPADASSENPVVLINQTLAEELFGDEDPVGERLQLEGEPRIVGVVGDVRGYGPDRELVPYLYTPTTAASNLILRTDGEPAAFVPELRRIVRELEPGARVYSAETMESIIAASLGDRRFQLVLTSLFATVALVLGAVGIYGMMAYSIEGQMHDFGVRLAVGARGTDIRNLVLVRSGTLTVVGIAAGLAGAYWLSRFVEELLYDVSPVDTAVYAAVAAVMLAVSALSCWHPARRAAAADPLETLRRQ